MRDLLAIVAATTLAGCTLKVTNPALYGSDTLAPSQRAVISSLGIHTARDLRIQVTAINGENVDPNGASFIVPPGSYRITMNAVTGVRVGQSAQGLTYSDKKATGEVSVTVRPGHTYIPNGSVQGDRIRLYFDDAGPDFPTGCLPLYVVINNPVNPGASIYRTDEKCAR